MVQYIGGGKTPHDASIQILDQIDGIFALEGLENWVEEHGFQLETYFVYEELFNSKYVADRREWHGYIEEME